MTSSLDAISAASDDGECRWHAAKLRQTRHKSVVKSAPVRLCDNWEELRR